METIASVAASRPGHAVTPAPDRLRPKFDHPERANVRTPDDGNEQEKRDLRVTVQPFSLSALTVCGLALFFVGFCSGHYGAYQTSTDLDRDNPPAPQATLQSSPAANSATGVQSAGANANQPALVHVVMKNMKFDPPTVELKAGDTVEWTNQDITPHTATAVPSFDSGSIDPDKSWRHTFTAPGSFAYSCTFHPDMKAAVTVK